MLWGREQCKMKHKEGRQLLIGTVNEKTRSVSAEASDMGARGAGGGYSAKHIWEYPPVPEGILGAGDTALLEGMTSKGEEFLFFFRKYPSALCFLLQVAGMDNIGRSRMRRWIVLAGPLTEEEVRRHLHPKSQQEDLEQLEEWQGPEGCAWATSLSWSTLCHRRLMGPWRGGWAHAHLPLKEIPVCVTHSLRCK